MDFVTAQIGVGGDIYSWIAWIVFFMIFFMFYPRLMLTQIMWKLEKTAKDLEDMSNDGKEFVIREVAKKPDKSLRESVNRFFEFFIISPVSLDPAGIIKKLDHMIRYQNDRFNYFVGQIAPEMDEEKKANIKMGLAAGISLYELSKIVRHFVEIARKTKSIQIAMILQMQMPLIENIAKSLHSGTKTLAKGRPIGDGLGPLAVATLTGNQKMKDAGDEIVMSEVKLDGRNISLLKASGPGGRVGNPGKAFEKVASKQNVSLVITIDAAAKMEGEKTGSLAEGVGVAMGGPGVERSYIEDVVVKKNIPLDSIVVKMSQEEAIKPMRKAIKDAVPEVIESVKRSIARTKKGDNIIIIGVGNSSGVGNSIKEAKETEKWVDAYHKKRMAKKKKK